MYSQSMKRAFLHAILFFAPIMITSANFAQDAEVTKWARRPSLPAEPANYMGKCPVDQTEFADWFRNLIFSMHSPEQTPTRFRWVAQCESLLKGTALEASKKCSANLTSLNVAYDESRYGLNVGPDIHPDQAPAPPVLPAILNDPKLVKTMKDGSDDELRQALNNAIPQLPADASVMVFYSGSSHARTVTIILPGQKEDVYYHYIGDANPSHGMSADVIKVHRLDASGEVSASPKIDYFSFDYTDANGPHAHAQGDRCNSCHRSGTRAIVPEDGNYNIFMPNKAESRAIYDAFDKRRPESETQRPGISYNHLGPEMGNDMITRSGDPAFVAKCASSALPNAGPEEIKKISENMNCVKCHSEDGRSDVLKYPMDVRDFSLNTLNNVILRGHMPQGADDPKSRHYLKPVERSALLRCLKQDYFGGFKDEFWSQGNPDQPGTLMTYLTKNCVTPAAPNGASSASAVVPSATSGPGAARGNAAPPAAPAPRRAIH